MAVSAKSGFLHGSSWLQETKMAAAGALKAPARSGTASHPPPSLTKVVPGQPRFKRGSAYPLLNRKKVKGFMALVNPPQITYTFSVAAVTHLHRFSGLKSQPCPTSQFCRSHVQVQLSLAALWSEIHKTTSKVWLEPCPFSQGPEDESALKFTQVVGRIWLHVVVGLRSWFSPSRGCLHSLVHGAFLLC